MKSLIFVVQRHDASHLHYDLRLEAGGVLKSWAVPKEPPIEPGIRRLAIMVEDHKLSYANFTGKIPEGEYGAGTVKIWDSGTYKTIHEEKNIEDEITSGHVAIIMSGKKLKGKYALLETDKTKKTWIFMKMKE